MYSLYTGKTSVTKLVIRDLSFNECFEKIIFANLLKILEKNTEINSLDITLPFYEDQDELRSFIWDLAHALEESSCKLPIKTLRIRFAKSQVADADTFHTIAGVLADIPYLNKKIEKYNVFTGDKLTSEDPSIRPIIEEMRSRIMQRVDDCVVNRRPNLFTLLKDKCSNFIWTSEQQTDESLSIPVEQFQLK